MRRIVLAAAITLSFLLSVPAFAIVNVEQAIIGLPEDGVHTRIEAVVDGAAGNTQKIGTRAELLSHWQHGRHADFLLLQYAYGKSSGVVDNNRFFAHLRHRTQISELWGIEGFGQVGRDPFARVSLRTLLGGGVRWTLMEEVRRSAVYLGLGVFYEHERLSPRAGTTDPLQSRLWRANSYLVLKRRLNEQLRLTSTTYYQPDIGQTADFRLLEQFAVTVKMDDHLNLELSIDVTHDSRPPQGVKRTDARYSTAIAIDF